MGRVAVDFGVGQGAKRSADIQSPAGAEAKRATRANTKINATVDGVRQKGSWPRKLSGLAASLGRYPAAAGSLKDRNQRREK